MSGCFSKVDILEGLLHLLEGLAVSVGAGPVGLLSEGVDRVRQAGRVPNRVLVRGGFQFGAAVRLLGIPDVVPVFHVAVIARVREGSVLGPQSVLTRFHSPMLLEDTRFVV